MPTNRYSDLIPVFGFSAATLIAVFFIDNWIVRLITSAPLLFFFTGHALLRAIGFVGSSIAEHAAYAVGTSIAICLAGGLFLNAIGCLSAAGWALWLGGFATASALFARVRRVPPFLLFTTLPQLRFRRWQIATVLAAVLLTGAAYGLSARDEARHRQFKYTEFWMVGAAAAPGRMTIGVSSHEAAAKRFDIEVRLDDAVVALWRSIDLQPGDTWTRELPLAAAGGRRIEAFLYQPDQNTFYRRVSAIIPGK